MGVCFALRMFWDWLARGGPIRAQFRGLIAARTARHAHEHHVAASGSLDGSFSHGPKWTRTASRQDLKRNRLGAVPLDLAWSSPLERHGCCVGAVLWLGTGCLGCQLCICDNFGAMPLGRRTCPFFGLEQFQGFLIFYKQRNSIFLARQNLENK